MTSAADVVQGLATTIQGQIVLIYPHLSTIIGIAFGVAILWLAYRWAKRAMK